MTSQNHHVGIDSCRALLCKHNQLALRNILIGRNQIQDLFCLFITYQFLNRQVLGPGKLDFFLDSASLVVGLMIFGNFYIWSTRSFWGKLIWRLKRGVKVGTQNKVKYASNQKNKGTLFSQLFHEIWWNAITFSFCACFSLIWNKSN